MKNAGMILVLLAALAMGAHSAGACCFYNHSCYAISVGGPAFDDDVAPSNHGCTDGTGGTFSVYVEDPFGNIQSETARLPVDDHGWLSVYKKDNNKWKVQVKDKDGNVQKTLYLEYTGD